ncbi:MAG: hypothetical protein ACM30G_06675 [Micromonosporaceae bacterium]
MASPDTNTQTVEDLRDPQPAGEMPPREDEPGREDPARPEPDADMRGEPEPAVGRAAVAEPDAERAVESDAERAVDLLPGAEPAAPISPLWSGDTSRALRDRFRELQMGFLDDPRSAAAAADALVGETIDSLRSALTEQHRELQAWQHTGADDTEQLRVAVQRYRDFLDRVLAL